MTHAELLRLILFLITLLLGQSSVEDEIYVTAPLFHIYLVITGFNNLFWTLYQYGNIMSMNTLQYHLLFT